MAPPVPKRRWSTVRGPPPRRSKKLKACPSGAGGYESPEELQMLGVVHQFGVVGGDDYDCKEVRLEQLLLRLPAHIGTTMVFASSASVASVRSTIERCRRQAVASASRIRKAEISRAALGASNIKLTSSEDLGNWTCGKCTLSNEALFDECSACGTRRGAFPKIVVSVVEHITSCGKQTFPGDCQLVINYDFPRSAADYIRRLSALEPKESHVPEQFRAGYTFVEEEELKGRPCRELISFLQSMRRHVDAAKAAEFDSALQLLEFGEDGEEEEDAADDNDYDEECCCAHCRGSILGSTSYHPLLPVPGVRQKNDSCVEVVRVPLRILEDFDKAVPFIAPRLQGHMCTLICLHCLNIHTPWDGWEQYFAPPELTGTIRVVLVLADDASWHAYPDSALLCAGGSSWVDILDMDSMDRSDMLLERLVEHEAALLDGHSERIVMMGMSQGGGQSMLRFLRSGLRLGGWIGSVCHVPTAPHTPRDRDPLTVTGRPIINCDRPVRLLAGESDCVFAPGLVLRDAARLRDVGGFTNVEVEVRKRLTHEGPMDDPKPSKPATPKKGDSGGVDSAQGLLQRKAIAKDASEDQRQKSLIRAEKNIPDLLFAQKYLPLMVDLCSLASTDTEVGERWAEASGC